MIMANDYSAAKRELLLRGTLLVADAMKPELGADFRTHEEDVGDPEADRY